MLWKLMMEAIKQEFSPAFMSWFGKSVVVNEDGSPKVVYHGSNNVFDEFDDAFMGTNATALGKGFYFTDSEDFARGYSSDTGKIYNVYLSLQKPISTTKKTITRAALTRFIKAIDPTGDDFLSNYGDVYSVGYQTVLKNAVDNEYQYNDNDVDLLHSIYNVAGIDYKTFFRLVHKILGFDGIVSDESNGHIVYIVWFPEQIKSVNATKWSKESGKIDEELLG